MGLTGANVLPPGDFDAFVELSLKIVTTGDVCITSYREERIAPVTAIGIYRAPSGENGPLALDVTLGPAHLGCVRAEPRLLASIIIAQPADYYVLVNTTQYPDGAVRAQLTVGP